jgi:signal transduction histidine kinase
MSHPDDKQPVVPRIADFYGRLFSRSWLTLLTLQILLVSLIIVVALFSLTHFDITTTLLVILATMVLLESLVGFLFLRWTLKPVDVISRALAEVNGENLTLDVAYRNDPRLAKSGLKIIVDAIYREAKAPTNIGHPAGDETLLKNLLMALPIGFAALDAKRQIIASNHLAPIGATDNQQPRLQLDFATAAQSLDNWLDTVEKTAVNAERYWKNIQDRPQGVDGRRVFDVLAHYKKDAPSGIETIIVMIDRTNEYLDNEISMDFITLAAHELRGPITIIRGYLDMLGEQLNGQLTPAQNQLIDRLNVGANRLSSYVNNILNVSHYDRQHLQIKLVETKVENIIDDVKNDMELRARTLNRHLLFQIPHDLPSVAADLSSISEVISNLIDNAIKYSHDGGQVEVSAQADGDFVAISVRDYGIGMPAAVAEHLFSKFYRSHRSRGAISGSGLGLYISRAIVASHGGHISVSSRENEGSTFTFTLPIYATVAQQLAASGGDNTGLITKQRNWIHNHGKLEN